MEVFSTQPRNALPWTANILTVAALLAATWWSAGQRPVSVERPVFAAATDVASLSSDHQSKDQARTSAPGQGPRRADRVDAAPSAQAAPLGQGVRAQATVHGDPVQPAASAFGARPDHKAHCTGLAPSKDNSTCGDRPSK